MRKTIVFILLLIYTGSQLLPVLIYYHEPVIHTISIFRQQIRSGIREEKGSTLSITISNEQYLLAKRPKNEIILDGTRYDIKKIRISGDKVSMELLKDEKEDYLLHLFKRMSASSKNNHPQKKTCKPGKWFFKTHIMVKRISILPSGVLLPYRPLYKTPPDLLPVSLNPQEHPPEFC